LKEKAKKREIEYLINEIARTIENSKMKAHFKERKRKRLNDVSKEVCKMYLLLKERKRR